MKWPHRTQERQNLIARLTEAKVELRLKGISNQQSTETLAWQLVASLRREDYYRLIQSKPIAARRANPNSASFDADRAVAFHIQQGNIDEAGWLIFLMTHFARHQSSGWQRLQDVYGKLGTGIWDWESVRDDPKSFYQWLSDSWQSIRGAFGNHRKYESLNPAAIRPMCRAVDEYLNWIGETGHQRFFANSARLAGNDPHTIFDRLYWSMNISSFGRLAKFDYLSLVGRYRLAPIAAGSAYLKGATGPVRGARLLFDGTTSSRTPIEQLQANLNELDSRLSVGMEVMEDALCNWQKSPCIFVHYKG